MFAPGFETVRTYILFAGNRVFNNITFFIFYYIKHIFYENHKSN